jgi:DNA-binding NarL/FixJ family response regulator
LSKARILLVDPNTLVGEGLRALIEPEFEVFGICNDDSSLFHAVAELKPDAVLLSIYRPFARGLATGSKLKAAFPRLRIIVVTDNNDVEAAVESVRHWASGYLHLKSLRPELAKALRDALRGAKYLTPVLRTDRENSRSLRSTAKLTSREEDVLHLLATGCTMREVGVALGITPRTVAFHKYRIMERLGIQNNFLLLQFAMRRNLADPD